MINLDTALIFEGGGMRNAYTAACVHRLITEKIHFGWVGGISAGASHTVNFLSGDAHRARSSFVDMVSDPKMAGWQNFLAGRGYFNADYIYEQAPLNGESPFDYTTFCEDPTPYRIGATRADTGETVYFSRENNQSLGTLMKQVRASSTMPFFMPITYIDGVPFVDGALGKSGGIALDAAEEDGFEKFLVILTRPREYFKNPVRRPHAVRRALRKHPAVAEVFIERPENYNATKRRLLDLEKEGRAKIFFPEHMEISNREIKLEKLKSAYELGAHQTDKEWDSWMSFLS